ncbi:MAG: DUF2914 domain-containing protein, partial [Pricia sp.]
CLTLTLYGYNLSDDGRWKNTFLERFEEFFPLAIQFFFGGLSSAYVIYFSRSVSLSKTATFFIILLALLFANEFLKKRISNKYLQFSAYFFISFTFFTFMIPVFMKDMGTRIFIFSGLVSLGSVLALIILIYRTSPSARMEIRLPKLLGIIAAIYAFINVLYIFNLIPPVPLALDEGMVAHKISIENHRYVVSYEKNDNHIFWRDYRQKFHHTLNGNVYVFSSIFAPTDFKESVLHRWKWYDSNTEEWVTVEDIGFDITGGRDNGFRGYTYKNNVWAGQWEVDVITNEGLVLGVIDFEIVMVDSLDNGSLANKKF